jgi:hypothetical protein
MGADVDPAGGGGAASGQADPDGLPVWRPDPRQLGWFSLAAVALHLPGLVVRLFNSDEASLATMATVLARGGRLYHDTADRKPPIVPYLYSLVFRLTGSTDIRPVRVVAVVSLVATAVLLANEVRRRHGSRRLALACGLLFLFAYVAFFPDDSQAATFELFQLLPMTAAVVVAARGRSGRAGVYLALATLCKQTAVTTVLPVAYLVHRRRGTAGLARMALGFGVPIAVAAGVLGPGPFLLWTVTGNGGYLGSVGSVQDAFLRGLAMTAAAAALELGLVFLCTRAARGRTASVDLWLWMVSGLVAVVAGFRFFGHYYLPLLPPAVLIAGSVLAGLRVRTRQLVGGVVAAPALVCAVIGFFPTGDSATIPIAELAKGVRDETSTGDTVLVWGDLPELYWASGREPASRFIHTGFLTGNSGGRPGGSGDESDALPGAWEMLDEDLSRRPADLIVDTSTAAIRQQDHYPLSATPLWEMVTTSYHLVGTIDGVRLYRLGPPR